ncbi:uroporphyrinogen-III synthase [Alkalihalobacterium bogoriense]|uniref:uroporphyrinogen-III synthase n=1 Tax=Alkalihalobacterium bogoriense TaxID=246272 RepID=UPI00055150D8|nr:uroporphyrinogen-III synthase [Alkalihalobacterium bogoriense]
MGDLPLSNKRIVVTRSKDQAPVFSEKIKQYGGIAIEVPLIKIKEADDMNPVLTAVQHLDFYDWIVFTSVNAVVFFMDAVYVHTGHRNLKFKGKIAVVGEKTKEAVQQFAIEPSFMPDEFVAEAFVTQLIPLLKKEHRILFPKGNLARDIVPTSLRKYGCTVDDIVVYSTTINHEAKPELLRILNTVDVMTFTSSSTVTNFFTLLHDKQVKVDHLLFCCIGPITAKTLQKYGIENPLIAKPYTIDGVVQSLLQYYEEEKK